MAQVSIMGLYRPRRMRRPVRISKEALEKALADNPNCTLAQLSEMFDCGTTTVARRLGEFGLQTKPWSERKQSDETRQKISRTRVALGVARGDRNPNAGEKPRPWLEGEKHPLRVWHRQHPEFGEQQRGENNPVHQVSHLYEDPAYVQRITREIRAHADAKRGHTYEETYGEAKAADYKDKLRRASPVRMRKFKRRVTRPEQIVRSLLTQLGVVFESEVPLGHHTVDFLVPEAKVVIQADGDYWHAHPLVYGEGEGRTPLSRGQKNRCRLDAACDAYLENRGYTVLRFWERDLQRDPAGCLFRLKEVLHVQ